MPKTRPNHILHRGSMREDCIITSQEDPQNSQLSTDPDVYRRDLIYKYINAIEGKSLKELLELENMYALLKGHLDNEVYRKVIDGKKLGKEDLAYFKLLKEVLIDLHRAKHGDKHLNVGVQFKDIQEMMQNSSPSDN